MNRKVAKAIHAAAHEIAQGDPVKHKLAEKNFKKLFKAMSVLEKQKMRTLS